MHAVLPHLRRIEDEVGGAELRLGHAQQDQRLAGAGIGDDDALRAIGHRDLLARAVEAEIHLVGGRVEGDLVDLPELVRARIDGVGGRRHALLPGERAR
jgi:hypothetical protein